MHVTLPSIIPRTSQETSVLLNRVQKVMFLSCDWWILLHSVCFCFKMTVMIMIDGSLKPNRILGFELQSWHSIERRSNMHFLTTFCNYSQYYQVNYKDTMAEKEVKPFSHSHNLEQYVLLAKTARGAGLVALINQTLEAPGVYVFGELIEMPSVKAVCTVRQRWSDIH